MKYMILFVLTAITVQANEQLLIRAARYVIQQNEGVRYEPYKCSNGHLTIGIGHKIVAGESFGRIDDKKVQELFANDIQHHIKRCRRFLPSFNSYPVCVQVAILDGFFRGDLSGSPKTLKLMRQGKFLEASKEYLDNREYRRSKRQNTGVYKRMDKNAQKFKAYGESML
jgi:GH24 family phage-related lysozyme (muramidase)